MTDVDPTAPPASRHWGRLAMLVAQMPSWFAMILNQDELDVAPPSGSNVNMRPLRTAKELVEAHDAAVAGGFVLQVVEPHLNGPGGDLPILVWPERERRIRVLCGQGPAPALATVRAMRALGFGIDCLFVTRGIHSEEFEGIDQLDPVSVKELFGHPPKALMRELKW